jgi:pimeloyl-[acyl-carrier protein] methyl ester esterase
MSLYVEMTGDGPDLVLLHGWGLHGGLFAPLVERLSTRFSVHAVDLPGHGRSRVAVGASLDEWTNAVLDSVPDRATWIGWSLGALLAIRAARNVERVSRLVLIAATPRFVTAPDWPHAQAPEALQRFASGLTEDLRGTVHAFLAYQSLGDEHARARIRELRDQVFSHGEPDPLALASGLEILRYTDLRDELARLAIPVLVIAGTRDRLTPAAASAAIADAVPGARYETVPGAAHAPFLSHPDAVASKIEAFADDR